MVNWNRYLESLCNAYAQWWQVYTITDVVGQRRVESEPSPLLFDFGLMVQTVERGEERGKGEEKIERLSVVEGLRKYASEHVLLVGRPGSGKSTALARLLLEEAQKARSPLNPPLQRGEEDSNSLAPPLLRGAGGVQPQTPALEEEDSDSLAPPLKRGTGGDLPKIPVLVELRYYRTSILDLIQDFLQRHDPNLPVDTETLKSWLRQGQLLLLVDGLNELPSEEARRDLQKFRQDYQKTTPMIFTTRDLGVGGDLNIAKKLEMQPLSEAQMQQFVRAYLPEQGEQMLRQLGDRLREFGQTPLLLWMLCSLFRAMGKVPPNLGLVFRQFTNSYDRKLKQDIPTSGESRRWWHRLLEHLAWVMTWGEVPTELQVAIPKQQAEAVLTEFLAGKVAHPDDCALRCLEDLLKHHLIQVGAGDQIEFRHQLIQEYYTAESLLKLLPSLGDDELKREYLNYLKWTEPLALMLELVEDEAQSVRVVKLALEVDLRLGARLAGVVSREFQSQAVSLITELKIFHELKIQLLGITRSETAISVLCRICESQSSDMCGIAIDVLRKSNSEAVVSALLQALNHENTHVCVNAAEALGEIGTEAATSALFQALKHKISSVRGYAARALRQIRTEAAVSALLQSLDDRDAHVRGEAAAALGQIGAQEAVPALLLALNDRDSFVRENAAAALGKIGAEAAVPALLQALDDCQSNVRHSAAYALGEIGAEAAVPALLQALDDCEFSVRHSTAYALGEIGAEEAVPALLLVLSDSDERVCRRAAEALRKLGAAEMAVSTLLPALKDKDSTIYLNATEALGQIGTETAVSALLQALNDKDSRNRGIVARVLGGIRAEEAVPELLQVLSDEDDFIYACAAFALSNIGTEAAISALLQASNTANSSVHQKATRMGVGALALIQAVKYGNDYVRRRAAEALRQADYETAVLSQLQNLKMRHAYRRRIGAEVLGEIAEPEFLPYLYALMQTSGEIFLFITIAAIQNRCKFYNYTLTQPILSSEPQLNIPPIQPIQQPIQKVSSKSSVKRDQVFISYSHKDNKWLDKLQTMLKPMIRNNSISVWADTAIKPGSKWRDEIEKALAAANVAVLMVSQNFLASDFIANHELPPLLNAAEQEGLKIIWVPVGYCLYEETEIEQYQAAHNPSQPLESLRAAKLNQVLREICKEIKAATESSTQP